ncbi:hypothetical protein C8Q73DRAFT_692404 [Cubamyces lactineus]|nr:hypothetical protein C8Q73DRAFT_692404 [Cubamyces lactineus]
MRSQVCLRKAASTLLASALLLNMLHLRSGQHVLFNIQGHRRDCAPALILMPSAEGVPFIKMCSPALGLRRF